MKKEIFVLHLVILLIIVSCAKKHVQKEMDLEESKIIKKKSESFADFYDHFHSDSLFQMSRVQFPVRGQRIDHDTSFTWNKDNWMLIKYKVREIDTSEFRIRISETSNMVTEEVEYKIESGFFFESKYQLINGTWYLVECNDYNL